MCDAKQGKFQKIVATFPNGNRQVLKFQLGHGERCDLTSCQACALLLTDFP